MANENKFRRLQCEQGASALITEQTGFYKDDDDIINDDNLEFDGNITFGGNADFGGEVDFTNANVIGISGGTKLYRHSIIFQDDEMDEYRMNIITYSNTAFTYDSLKTYMSNPANSYIFAGGGMDLSNNINIPIGLTYFNNGVVVYTIDNNSSAFNVIELGEIENDTVIAL